MGNVDCLRDEIKGNQKDPVNLKEDMSSKMDEGFKREQQARQRIQCEIVLGFKNEEKTIQLVQKELAVVKDQLKNLMMGSGSTVCSEGQYRVGAGVWYLCSATATHFSVECNFRSKEDGILRLGHRSLEREHSRNHRR